MQKTAGGEIFITTSKPLEKIVIDILTMAHGKYILTFVDFFTRLIRPTVIKDKSTEDVKKALEKFINELGMSKELITDEVRKFKSKELTEMLDSLVVKHHITSVEHHQSNGRMERLHKTIWQGLRK